MAWTPEISRLVSAHCVHPVVPDNLELSVPIPMSVENRPEKQGRGRYTPNCRR